jgi:hypothetical protein
VAHGRDNSTLQASLSPAEEEAYVREVTTVIERHFGTRPKGWLGPFRSASTETNEILARAGYTHSLDWGNDDQPFLLKTREGRICAVPYSVEVHDVTAFVRHGYSGCEFQTIVIDAFETLHADGARSPRVLGISLPPFPHRQSFRIRYLMDALEHIQDSKVFGGRQATRSQYGRSRNSWFDSPPRIGRSVRGAPPPSRVVCRLDPLPLVTRDCRSRPFLLRQARSESVAIRFRHRNSDSCDVECCGGRAEPPTCGVDRARGRRRAQPCSSGCAPSLSVVVVPAPTRLRRRCCLDLGLPWAQVEAAPPSASLQGTCAPRPTHDHER